MTPTSRLDIDLSALDANLRAWRNTLGDRCAICAVVKADGYGLGAVPLARRLVAAGVTMLAVYCPEQAAQLATAGFVTDLLVLMPVEALERTDALYRPAVAGRLHLAVHSPEHLEQVEAIGLQFGARLPVHLEIDTGLSRGGMLPDLAESLLRSLPGRRGVKLAGLFTHTASPDQDIGFTDLQLSRFDELLRRCAPLIAPEVAIHFAGTYAALRDRRYHKTTVRLGLGLLGYGAQELAGPPILPQPPSLRPVLRWLSRVVHLHDVPAGATVGYNAMYTTPRPSRLGIVPVGYADGYPVALSNRSVVRVRLDDGSLRAAEVRGRINMDQIIIDLTGLPAVRPGAEVELIAADPAAPNALPALARLAEATCYELLAGLSPRLLRRYVTLASGGQVGLVANV
jgi:alanine racemase